MPFIKRNATHALKRLTINNELEEVGLRQLYDEQSNTYTYVIWDKVTEEAVIVNPVRTQLKRDLVVCTNLKLVYTINSHVHNNHCSGSLALKRSIKGLRSVISKASGADADELIQDGDEVHFGSRHIKAIATPGHTLGCMSFLLDDGKAIITGDTIVGGVLSLTIQDPWSLADSIVHTLLKLDDNCIVLPIQDTGTGNFSTIREERDAFDELGCSTIEDFVDYLSNTPFHAEPPQSNIFTACNMKDGANPFNIRSLRDSTKNRWGIFG